MTVGEILAEVQAGMGNLSDFTSAAGQARIIRWMNWSQYELAGFHRQRVLPPKRFHVLEGKKIFPTVIQTQLVSVPVPGDGTAIFINNGSIVVDYYQDWVIQITDYDTVGAGQEAPAGMLEQKRVIRSYEGAPSFYAHVWPAWDVIPDAYCYITLYRKVYSMSSDVGLDPMLKLWGVQRVEKLDDAAPLEQKPWVELMASDYLNIGPPGSFSRRGTELIFDVTPDQVYYYRMFYYMFPTPFSSSDLTASPIFPEYWHEVIVEGAIYQAFTKLMEPSRAEDQKNKWLDAAANKYDEYEIEVSHESKGAKMRFK